MVSLALLLFSGASKTPKICSKVVLPAPDDPTIATTSPFLISKETFFKTSKPLNCLLIFSNLMGPILAGDMGLPDYKLKQNEKIGNFELEKFYNEKFSDSLDNYLKDDDIIDLRAGFYEKFYKINKPYTTMKFIKDGKVVSHWAKAYRGVILNLLAQNNIQTIEELMNMEIEDLSIEEIKKQKLKTEIIYNIN